MPTREMATRMPPVMTRPFNLAGAPAISVNCGSNSHGAFVSQRKWAWQFRFSAEVAAASDGWNYVIRSPADVAVAYDGSVYISGGDHRIRKFSIGQ